MEALAASLATTGGTTAAAGTFGAAGGASLGAGFTGVGAGSAAASVGGAAAGGSFFSGLGTFLSSVTPLDTLTTVLAFDSVVSPIITGNRNADILAINAQQQEFDANQKLLQGREQSVRALETLNSQQAFNVVQGFASGTGLSQSTAAANDELSRKHKFDDGLRRTTNLLQVG